MVMRYWIAILCLVTILNSFGQQTGTTTHPDTAINTIIQTIDNIPSRSLDYIDKKYSRLSADVQKQSEKLLQRLQDKEARLQRKLQRIDSTKSKELFETSKAKYQELQNKVQGSVDKTTAKLKEYIPGLDSMNTALKFLSQNNDVSGIATDKLNQLSSVTGSVQELQGRLQQANEIQAFIRERETRLKEALMNKGFGKELLGINKEVYYYQERLREYKELLNDKKKLEEKLLNTLGNLPPFKQFMQKHGYLSQLFRIPGTYDPTQPMRGLQTRAGLQTIMAQQYGGIISNPQQVFQQHTQLLESQLNVLKNKLNEISGTNNTQIMPDFKPNDQKTKQFLQRIEIGFDIQNTRSSNLLPATSDIALTAGYKFSDKATIGLGASYKLGWGSDWNDMQFSNQGIGLRSYADLKIKGTFWLNGGFEYNYLSAFKKIEEIRNLDIWQKSALIGVEKKYKVGKKKEGKLLLLYDFLANKNIPQSSALKFRLGWTF